MFFFFHNTGQVFHWEQSNSIVVKIRKRKKENVTVIEDRVVNKKKSALCVKWIVQVFYCRNE